MDTLESPSESGATDLGPEPAPELRLVAAAAALDRFSAEDLAAAAECNANTARSWLQRWKLFLESTPGQSLGRGRPRMMHRLSIDGMERARAQLDAVHREIAKHSSGTGEQVMLDEVELLLDVWRAAALRRPGEAHEVAEFEALRLRLLGCWRHFARLDAVGGTVGFQHLLRLAEMEASANLVVPQSSAPLSHLAEWLAGRFARIRAGDGTASFAARAMHARIETRPAVELATSAALMAPVIGDEGYATDSLTIEDWSAVLLVAEEISVTERLSRVELVLSGADGVYFDDDGEAQAVLRGLTACRAAATDLPLRDWLAGVIRRSEWRDAFAPVVVHGLLQSDGVSLDMCTPYRDHLQPGIDSYDGNPGALRFEAFSIAERFERFSSHVGDMPVIKMIDPVPTRKSGTVFAVRPSASPTWDLVANTFGTRSLSLLQKA